MTNERQVGPGSCLPALRRGAWDLHFDDDFLLQQLQVYLLAHGHPSLFVLPDGEGQAFGFSGAGGGASWPAQGSLARGSGSTSMGTGSS